MIKLLCYPYYLTVGFSDEGQDESGLGPEDVAHIQKVLSDHGYEADYLNARGLWLDMMDDWARPDSSPPFLPQHDEILFNQLNRRVILRALL
jgi:hypothetical protein